jgi:cobyrinic acid a,c-diamide synthase
MRGIAPLLIGYQVFDKEVNIAGVIANMSGGKRHESKLRAAVEEYTDIPFLGALEKHADLGLDERHLGLIPGYEDPYAQQKIASIASAVNDNIDLDRLLEISQQAGEIESATLPLRQKNEFSELRIGIARDRAFGFYYPGDLEAFEQAGARLIPIDTMRDNSLPALDGLFIGGGFPERHAAELAANSSLRQSIKAAIEAGLPTYAECGGLMYLARSLRWHDASHDMVGVLPADCKMHDKPQGRGYVKLDAVEERHPWLPSGQAAARLRAHEFHYSSLEGLPDDSNFAYRVERGAGIRQKQDGLLYRNPILTSATPFPIPGLSVFSALCKVIKPHTRTASPTPGRYYDDQPDHCRARTDQIIHRPG